MTDDTQPAKWQLGDIHHIGLTVSDLERSIQFYRDLLGLTLIRRRPHVREDYISQQTGYEGVELSVASFRVSDDIRGRVPAGVLDSGAGSTNGDRPADRRPSLEIVQYISHAGDPRKPATNRAGSSHLCLLVDDLRACYEDLSTRGVPFKSEPVTITAGPNEGGLVIYLLDPDGYTIEMFQPPA